MLRAWDDEDKTHTYGTGGVYEVRVIGKLEGFRFNDGGDKYKLLNITEWGGLRLGNGGGYFYDAKNLKDITADDVNLSGTTDFSGMFRNAGAFNGDVGGWDVSGVTDMSYMFSSATAFNQSLSSWDVSGVTDMVGLFFYATAFNQSLSSWDVSGVTDMSEMFRSATAFNQDIGDWDVSSVTDMSDMFRSATAFNQDLSGWRVCNVTTHTNFDNGASAWNSANKPKLGSPCVVSVTSTNDDGFYGVGDVVSVVVEFNENVSVSGVSYD